MRATWASRAASRDALSAAAAWFAGSPCMNDSSRASNRCATTKRWPIRDQYKSPGTSAAAAAAAAAVAFRRRQLSSGGSAYLLHCRHPSLVIHRPAVDVVQPFVGDPAAHGLGWPGRTSHQLLLHQVDLAAQLCGPALQPDRCGLQALDFGPALRAGGMSPARAGGGAAAAVKGRRGGSRQPAR